MIKLVYPLLAPDNRGSFSIAPPPPPLIEHIHASNSFPNKLTHRKVIINSLLKVVKDSQMCVVMCLRERQSFGVGEFALLLENWLEGQVTVNHSVHLGYLSRKGNILN